MLEQAADCSRLGARLKDDRVCARIGVRVLVVVEQHVVFAPLGEIVRVEALAALDENQPLSTCVARLARDAHARLGVEAVLPRLQFLAAERRFHVVVAWLGVEDAHRGVLERAALAAYDVPHEGHVDVASRPPPAPQPDLEKMEERVRVGSAPLGVLRYVPGMVELGRRRRCARLGSREIKPQKVARFGAKTRALAKEVRIEEAVGAVPQPLADQRIVQRREGVGALGPEPPQRVWAAPERPSRQRRWKRHRALRVRLKQGREPPRGRRPWDRTSFRRRRAAPCRRRRKPRCGRGRRGSSPHSEVQ